jgi:hypothetical protein
MSSLCQIEANRHNALKSTGPKTEAGKQRSRRNALRHGFTAETVIEPLENPKEYRAFEDAIEAFCEDRNGMSLRLRPKRFEIPPKISIGSRR